MSEKLQYIILVTLLVRAPDIIWPDYIIHKKSQFNLGVLFFIVMIISIVYIADSWGHAFFH